MLEALNKAAQYQLYGMIRRASIHWRPWGLLAYRGDMLGVEDLNHALVFDVDQMDAAIDEILPFYKTRRCTPRIYYAGEIVRTRSILEERGFVFEHHPIDRFALKENNELPTDAPIQPIRELTPEIEALLLDEEGPWMVDIFRATVSMDCRWWTLFADGKPVSLLSLSHYEGIAMIENVKTLEAARGKGYASRLIGAVVAGHDRGIPLLLDTENPQARRIYERAGFRFAARVENFNAFYPL